MLPAEEVAVPIRGPESLPWVAERMTRYGGCGARVKGGMGAMSLSNATQLTKEDVTRDDPPRHEWLEVIGGRYVSALLAASRGEGEVDRQAGWGRGR